ncbi:MAG: hypothetical protein R3F37_01590 [Candidatus Competibacteraceae bacterium]
MNRFNDFNTAPERLGICARTVRHRFARESTAGSNAPSRRTIDPYSFNAPLSATAAEFGLRRRTAKPPLDFEEEASKTSGTIRMVQMAGWLNPIADVSCGW